MSALPHDPFELAGAPEPMAPLTHVIISPANIALEARLNRSKPLTWWQLWKLKREAAGLRQRIENLSVGWDELLVEFRELKESLKLLFDHKLQLAQERQINPEDANLKAQMDDLREEAEPMYRRYQVIRKEIEQLQALAKSYAAINERIEDNPKVIARLKADEEAYKLQKEEARSYEQLIIDRLTQLGFCYRWTNNKGAKQIDHVKFSEVHITTDAVYFKLSASYRTAFGAWRTKMPYGVKIGDLIKEETLLELSYGCQRQVSARANIVNGAWLVVHRLDTNDGLLTQVKYAAVMERYPLKYHGRFPLCVGVTYHRTVQWLNLADYPHMLIAGFTGSGKSNFVNSIICTLITRHSPDEIRLVLVDLKDGLEFDYFEHLPHLHGTIVDKVSSLADRLEELQAIMQSRNQQMRGKAKSLQDYNAKYPDEAMPRIVCIIDEVASIMAQGELTKRINNSLRQLTAKGRAPGIHIILSTQRPSVDAIDGGIKVNLAARIVGRMPSNTDSMTVLGTGEAKDLAPVPGRMIMQIGPDPIPIQTPLIENEDVEEAIKLARAYDQPEELPTPEGFSVTEEWTPEKIVALSLNHLNGKISANNIWMEIKDEGGMSRNQVREMLERIWAMDCIHFEGRDYRVERIARGGKRLVEIEQIARLPDSE